MKKALLVCVLATAMFGTVKWMRHDAPAAKQNASLAMNRIWIDHIPRNDRDVFQVFVAITDDPFGIFQGLSQWTGKYELFNHETSGDQMRIVYPQTNEKEKVTTKATKCSVNDFDFCLELSGATRGVKKYYSMEGWEIEAKATPEQVEAKLASLQHSLVH
jgi:hypothetical protein